MLSDKQMDVVLDAYDSKYGTKGPRDKYGFPRASYRWHGFLAAYESLLPVIVAAVKVIQIPEVYGATQYVNGNKELLREFDRLKGEAGLC